MRAPLVFLLPQSAEELQRKQQIVELISPELSESTKKMIRNEVAMYAGVGILGGISGYVWMIVSPGGSGAGCGASLAVATSAKGLALIFGVALVIPLVLGIASGIYLYHDYKKNAEETVRCYYRQILQSIFDEIIKEKIRLDDKLIKILLPSCDPKAFIKIFNWYEENRDSIVFQNDFIGGAEIAKMLNSNRYQTIDEFQSAITNLEFSLFCVALSRLSEPNSDNEKRQIDNLLQAKPNWKYILKKGWFVGAGAFLIVGSLWAPAALISGWTNLVIPGPWMGCAIILLALYFGCRYMRLHAENKYKNETRGILLEHARRKVVQENRIKIATRQLNTNPVSIFGSAEEKYRPTKPILIPPHTNNHRAKGCHASHTY